MPGAKGGMAKGTVQTLKLLFLLSLLLPGAGFPAHKVKTSRPPDQAEVLTVFPAVAADAVAPLAFDPV